MMSLGMTPVIITGGIDLSVGSVMGFVAIVSGLVLLSRIDYMPDWWINADWTHAWWMAVLMALAAGRDRARQWLPHRLCRPAALRGDTRHAVGRALARGRAFGNRMLYHFGPARRRPSS